MFDNRLRRSTITEQFAPIYRRTTLFKQSSYFNVSMPHILTDVEGKSVCNQQLQIYEESNDNAEQVTSRLLSKIARNFQQLQQSHTNIHRIIDRVDQYMRRRMDTHQQELIGIVRKQIDGMLDDSRKIIDEYNKMIEEKNKETQIYHLKNQLDYFKKASLELYHINKNLKQHHKATQFQLQQKTSAIITLQETIRKVTKKYMKLQLKINNNNNNNNIHAKNNPMHNLINNDAKINQKIMKLTTNSNYYLYKYANSTIHKDIYNQNNNDNINGYHSLQFPEQPSLENQGLLSDVHVSMNQSDSQQAVQSNRTIPHQDTINTNSNNQNRELIYNINIHSVNDDDVDNVDNVDNENYEYIDNINNDNKNEINNNNNQMVQNQQQYNDTNMKNPNNTYRYLTRKKLTSHYRNHSHNKLAQNNNASLNFSKTAKKLLYNAQKQKQITKNSQQYNNIATVTRYNKNDVNIKKRISESNHKRRYKTEISNIKMTELMAKDQLMVKDNNNNNDKYEDKDNDKYEYQNAYNNNNNRRYIQKGGCHLKFKDKAKQQSFWKCKAYKPEFNRSKSQKNKA